MLLADTGDSRAHTKEYDFGRPEHYRENCKSPGHFAFTVSSQYMKYNFALMSLLQCSKIFSGKMKYPIPSGKATDNKIGKGGNGFVFTMYHERRQYAVKKVIIALLYY